MRSSKIKAKAEIELDRIFGLFGFSFGRKQPRQDEYFARASDIYQKHFSSTLKDHEELSKKWCSGTGRKMKVSTAFLLLSDVYDITDREMGYVSQKLHSLQTAMFAMERGHDRQFVVTALVHDLGKIISLWGCPDHHVYCSNRVLECFSPSHQGLNSVLTNWNHDEYIYMRLKRFFDPDHQMLLRFHSLEINERTRGFLSVADQKWLDDFYWPFYECDRLSKSRYFDVTQFERRAIEMLDSYFPEEVNF